MKLALTIATIHGTFPVGAFVKSEPVVASQPGVTGKVISNDGTDFEVLWDFSRHVTKHSIATEAKAAADALEASRRWLASRMCVGAQP